jgi:hypothetical protein
MSSDTSRRQVLQASVAFTVGGALGAFSPREARANSEPLKVLTPQEGKTLEALGDVLLPGAAAAGIAHFVDSQLASDDPLLMLRYVDFPTPFATFYQTGLAALEALSATKHGASFSALASEAQQALVNEVATTMPEGWNGPPAPLFYFITRADAVDVVYGTREGFDMLDVPYMPHITPETSW